MVHQAPSPRMLIPARFPFNGKFECLNWTFNSVQFGSNQFETLPVILASSLGPGLRSMCTSWWTSGPISTYHTPASSVRRTPCFSHRLSWFESGVPEEVRRTCWEKIGDLGKEVELGLLCEEVGWRKLRYLQTWVG